MPKVGDYNLNAFGFQLLAPKVGDPKLGALGPQLSVLKVVELKLNVLGPQFLVLKVDAHLSAMHLFLEKKLCPNISYLKNLNQNS